MNCVYKVRNLIMFVHYGRLHQSLPIICSAVSN